MAQLYEIEQCNQQGVKLQGSNESIGLSNYYLPNYIGVISFTSRNDGLDYVCNMQNEWSDTIERYIEELLVHSSNC